MITTAKLATRTAHLLLVRVAKLPMTAVLRTHTTGETTGSMKVLVEAAGDRILGFTMLGAEAGEVMGCGADGDPRQAAVHALP